MSVLHFPRLNIPNFGATASLSRLRWSWRNRRPVRAFFFDRPVVVLHSDDWGRLGIRDRSGQAELREAGLNLGRHPYDFYSLETADDVTALAAMLRKHTDSVGQSAQLQMNFVAANLDFRKMAAEGYKTLHWRALADGLPGKWRRPGLLQAYREGVEAGLFAVGFHGRSHFCARTMQAKLQEDGVQGQLLRLLLQAQTPYIHSRMPWVGFEYWDRTASDWGEFVSGEEQAASVGEGMRQLAKLFGRAPVSACAPGYRANASTHAAWTANGIRVAQSGPAGVLAPHMEQDEMLHVARGVEIEPVMSPHVTLRHSIHRANQLIEAGLPAVVSVHSINFQSKLANYRDYTLTHLDQFLTALERRFPRLLYVNDASLLELVTQGTVQTENGTVRVGVRQQRAPGYAFKSGQDWLAQDWSAQGWPESA